MRATVSRPLQGASCYILPTYIHPTSILSILHPPDLHLSSLHPSCPSCILPTYICPACIHPMEHILPTSGYLDGGKVDVARAVGGVPIDCDERKGAEAIR